jgi:hypothetical protein
MARHADLGVRYWLSTGETKISHNAQGADPTLGNPTSVLVYGNLDAHVLELFGRENFRNNLFLKAAVGVGRINRGTFEDEDYLAGQVKFSDTTSSMRDGRIGYGMIDLGHHWVLREGAISLGVFGGFSQWTEEYDAYGATDHLGFIGGDIDNSINVISNKVRGSSLSGGRGWRSMSPRCPTPSSTTRTATTCARSRRAAAPSRSARCRTSSMKARASGCSRTSSCAMKFCAGPSSPSACATGTSKPARVRPTSGTSRMRSRRSSTSIPCAPA